MEQKTNALSEALQKIGQTMYGKQGQQQPEEEKKEDKKDEKKDKKDVEEGEVVE